MFLLDANVFIEAKNKYYAFDIATGFWDWLDQSVANGDVATIIPIFKELEKGNDELAEWAKKRENSGWVLAVDDAQTQTMNATIANWVMGQDFLHPAKEDFLKGADPWLIAKAKVNNATVVTQ